MNKIEPLKYEESQREFIENNEQIAYNTAYRFFNLLIAQINLRIANSNLQTADTIYKTGQIKYNMGKISRNELLQLKFGAITAQKSKSKAILSRETSQLELSSYTGLPVNEMVTLEIPDQIDHFFIDDSIAVEKALENSQRSLAFKREVLEAQINLVKAKRESGLNADSAIKLWNNQRGKRCYFSLQKSASIANCQHWVVHSYSRLGKSQIKARDSPGKLKTDRTYC